MINRSHLLRAAALSALALSPLAAGCSSSSDTGRAKASGPASIPGYRPVNGGAGGASGAPSGFETARRDPPIKADTRVAAGELAESRGNLAQAVEQYRAALKLDPKHADAMFHLGVAYAAQKKYPEAIETWKRYVKTTGDSPQGYSNLGFCYELSGRPQEAEAAYEKGIAKDGSNVACRVNYGLMLVRKGRVGEGKLQLAAVLKPAEVHYNVGSVYESLGRKEQAKAEYRKSLELDPQFADAVTRLNDLECGPTSPTPGSGLSKTE